MACLPKVVALMTTVCSQESLKDRQSQSQTRDLANSSLFESCLRILQVAIDLLSEESVNEFMGANRNQPLRPVVQRLIDCQKSDVREVIQIVELLNSYAQYASGAAHLYRQNILTHLS